MAEFTRMVTVPVKDLGSIAERLKDLRTITESLKDLGVALSAISEVDVEVDVDVDISEFNDEEVISACDDIIDSNDHWISRVYRLMAEGDVTSAMEEMHRHHPQLAPPSHEKRLADLLSGNRSAARG